MSRHHHAMNQRRWQLVRRACLKRAKWRCENEKCGRPGVEVHHVVMLQENGPRYDLDGLIVLCRPCHLAKHKNRPSQAIPGQKAWAEYLEELTSC